MKDCALADLDSETVNQLMNLPAPWFGSFGFCALDEAIPAERVWFDQDDLGRITHAQYYRESKWFGIFNRIEIIGPFCLQNLTPQQLLEMKGAKIATFIKQREMEASHLIQAAGGLTNKERTNEDFIVELPVTSQEYFNLLSDNTRRNFHKHLKKYNLDIKPHVSIVTAFKDQITQEAISNLVSLNRMRIEGKGGVSLWDEELIRRRWI